MTPAAKPGRKALGRGLDALLGEAGSGAALRTGASGADGDGVTNIPVADIRPGRYQPRRRFDAGELAALAESIREKGVLQPILVRPSAAGEGAENGGATYELIAGERRWQAAQQAGLHHVPALVRTLDDRDALEIALVENMQRQDLSAIEEAEGFQRLIDEFGHTQEALAKALGKSRSHVANTLRLLGLPRKIRAWVEEGDLTAGHARALLTAEEPEKLARRVIADGLSVRQAEALARVPAGTPAPRGVGAATPPDPNTRALERDIGHALGLKATLRQKKHGGDLVLRYRDLDQLDELLRKIGVTTD